MPRRLPMPHDDMRARAVAVARDLVVADGLAGLNARRVAAAIGCSVGSLYNLFADLDDLVLHVAASVVDDMGAALFDEALPDDPAARLIEIARRYIRFAREAGRLWAMIFEHEPAHARPTPDWHLERIAAILARVHAAAAPAFAGRPVEEVRASVEVLWASVHGIAALSQKDKLGFVAEAQAEALAERLIATYLAGVAGRR